MSTKKLFPLSGIAFVALGPVGVIAIGQSTPDGDASASELASFYGEHTLQQSAAAFVLAASVPFLAFFGIGLARSVRSRADTHSVWADVLVAGTVLAAAGVLATAMVHFALADAADQGLSPGALQALNSLDYNTWIFFNPGLGVMMLGAAGALLTAGVLRSLAWVALVLGVALFVPFADFFAMVLTFVWMIVTGIVITRREQPAPRAVVAPTT